MPEPADLPMTTLADAAFRQAAAKVVRKAKQTGTPLILWERDRVLAIPPDEAQEEQPAKVSHGRNTDENS